jgi:hypothetical protein
MAVAAIKQGHTMGAEQPTARQLADLFGFSEDELTLNRAGAFSDRQRQQLVYQSIGYLVRGLAFIILDILLAITLYARLDRAWQQALFAALIVLLLDATALILRAAVKVCFPTVRSATGPLSRAGSANQPCIRTGALELRISYRRWRRLPPTLPGTYRVYYANAVNTLLSLEPRSEQ